MTESKADVQGVQFAQADGRRSSQRAGRAIFGHAAEAVDPGVAAQIRSASDWRKDYIEGVRRLVAAGARSTVAASRIAEAGVEAAHRELTMVRDGDELPLADALSKFAGDGFHTVTIKGRGRISNEGLAIPYRGNLLRGDGLRRQLAEWERRGVIEPSCTQAVDNLIAHPDWLDLSDLHIALLGASSEMGPLPSLSRWGANLIAVDLPRAHLWERIIGIVTESGGTLTLPSRRRASDDPEEVARGAGADLMTDAPEVGSWLLSLGRAFAIGNYVYADGAAFVRLAGAVDALIDTLGRPEDFPLAYLATPTDVYAVSSDIADSVVARRRRGVGARLAAALSAHRLYVDNYRHRISDDDGHSWALSDCLVQQQGPNYALAKSLQRWRAIKERTSGRLVSANLAPATHTRSVVANKVLAAAYAGAHRFGVEILESPTSSALMAALLVHDLRNPKAMSNPNVHLAHPYELWLEGAAHGGILRLPYEPRSVLPLAVLGGLPALARKAR